MPYIHEDDAHAVEFVRGPEKPGELNYVLSSLIANYVFDNGLSYQTINDVSGAMTEALAEFRRRLVIPYEEVKRRDGVDPYGHVASKATETDDDWIVRVNKKGTP